jgi:hypothetical protein
MKPGTTRQAGKAAARCVAAFFARPDDAAMA